MGEKRNAYRIWDVSLSDKKKDQLEDLATNRRILKAGLKRIMMEGNGVDWIHLAQDRDR
jgi:hypothetical protein